MIEPDYNEEIADLISQQAEEVYETGHFSRVNIAAQGRDGYTYQAIHQDEKLDSPQKTTRCGIASKANHKM